jgi:Cu(I)/Ag(I) efflux system membrane fusion protein
VTPAAAHGRTLYAFAGAGLATVVLAALLLLQNVRDDWPFAPQQETAEKGPGGNVRAETGGHERVSVQVDAAWVGNLGLQTEPARRENISRTLRAAATVVPDEERVSHVHARVSGWIEELHVRATGETVRAGQPLAAIFSQDLFASQVEYLGIRERAGGSPRSEIGEGARRRLQVMGMSDAEIADIERRGEARYLVTITAPRDGVVLRRSVSPGTAVDPSTELLIVADLSEVWVLAEVPEGDVPMVTEGAPVLVDLPASGRAPFEARVSFVYPTLSERTRSLRVRVVLDNKSLDLRPGMSGTVQFGSMPREALTVPRDAVVDTGEMQHVFVATSATQFEPRPVRLGMRLSTRVEILEGLDEGEPVLASGVFLIDSESRLRGSGGAGVGHAGHSAPRDAEAAASPDDRAHQGH